MADNIELDAVSGGSVVATDQKTGTLEHYQKIKVVYGADDSFNDVTSITTYPVPVALSATDNAVLDVIAGDTTSLDGKVTACNTGAVVISSGTITAVTDITNTVTVDGTGTFVVQEDGAALTALHQLGSDVRG